MLGELLLPSAGMDGEAATLAPRLVEDCAGHLPAPPEVLHLVEAVQDEVAVG